MELREIIIAMIAAFLFLVFLAIGVTFIIGNSMPSPTPTVSPLTSATASVYTPTGTTYVPTPSGNATSTGGNPTPVPTASGPRITSATIVDHGTDKDTYNRGDTATGYVTLKNTGNTVINNVVMDVSVSKSFSFIGYVKVEEASYPYSGENIQPGETRRIEFSTIIPSDYKGISTAGDFDFEVTVAAEGISVGSFTQKVKVL
jgi:uncharacterized repeat protein (TIGR01451 family)